MKKGSAVAVPQVAVHRGYFDLCLLNISSEDFSHNSRWSFLGNLLGLCLPHVRRLRVVDRRAGGRGTRTFRLHLVSSPFLPQGAALSAGPAASAAAHTVTLSPYLATNATLETMSDKEFLAYLDDWTVEAKKGQGYGPAPASLSPTTSPGVLPSATTAAAAAAAAAVTERETNQGRGKGAAKRTQGAAEAAVAPEEAKTKTNQGVGKGSVWVPSRGEKPGEVGVEADIDGRDSSVGAHLVYV